MHAVEKYGWSPSRFSTYHHVVVAKQGGVVADHQMDLCARPAYKSKARHLTEKAHSYEAASATQIRYPYHCHALLHPLRGDRLV